MNNYRIDGEKIIYTCPHCEASWDQFLLDSIRDELMSYMVAESCPNCNNCFDVNARDFPCETAYDDFPCGEAEEDVNKNNESGGLVPLIYERLEMHSDGFLYPEFHRDYRQFVLGFKNFIPRTNRNGNVDCGLGGLVKDKAIIDAVNTIRAKGYRITAGDVQGDIRFLAFLVSRIPEQHLNILKIKLERFYCEDVFGFCSFSNQEWEDECKQYSEKFIRQLRRESKSSRCNDKELINFYDQVQDPEAVKEEYDFTPRIARYYKENSVKYIDFGGLVALLCVFINVYMEMLDSCDASRMPIQDQAPVDPIEYEVYCSNIMTRNGWITELTKASGDFGADIVAVNPKTGNTMVVQCKRYSDPVGVSAVQEVVAAKSYYSAQMAAVVSTAGFTTAAASLADVNRVVLCHHSNLPLPS